MKTPARYPRTLTYLFVALALLGFLVAVIGSKVIFAIYAVVYAAVFGAFGLAKPRAARTDSATTASKRIFPRGPLWFPKVPQCSRR